MNLAVELRTWATHNLVLKLSALTLSVLMFAFVHGAEDMERRIYVDVLVSPPADSENMMLISEIPDRVRLALSGSRSRIKAIRPENLPPVEVRPRSVQDSQYYFDEQEFDLPAGVSVSKITPSSMTLSWARRSVLERPVEVVVEGKLPDGLKLEGITKTVPDTVTVEGPQPAVRALQRVRTAPFDASQLRVGENVKTLSLVPPPANTKFSASETTVTFTVGVELERRLFKDKKVVAKGGQVRAIRPRRVHVSLEGPPKALAALSGDDFEVMVDLSNLPVVRGVVLAPIQIKGLPESLKLYSVEPATVSVTLGQ